MLSEAIRYIMRIGRCDIMYRVQHPLADDLSGVQHLYLVHACSNPGDTQEHFAHDICVDKTTVAHQLQRLERSGYIRRTPDSEDGRCRCVYPTEKTQALLPLLYADAEAFTAAALDGLTAEEQRELARLTKKVWENARRLVYESDAPASR